MLIPIVAQNYLFLGNISFKFHLFSHYFLQSTSINFAFFENDFIELQLLNQVVIEFEKDLRTLVYSGGIGVQFKL